MYGIKYLNQVELQINLLFGQHSSRSIQPPCRKIAFPTTATSFAKYLELQTIKCTEC